jgi:hypothetical protein
VASRFPLLSALALLVALTVLLTWPQALYLGSRVAAHDDPLFSIWRLAWVAHILPAHPSQLFDANIFYPNVRTLAYSDAMLLESAIAAPWLWLNANPVLVYNLLLLGGIVSSGLAMFVLVRHLTRDDDAALVAAVVFTLIPYRVEHFIHLELQWTVWMPLAFLAVHRTIEDGSIRFGLLTGLLLWLQVISSIYYGAFLGMTVAVLAILLMASRPQLAAAAIVPLAAGAIVAIVLTVPYTLPYAQNTVALGARPALEVATFSAALDSYWRAPWQNWLWGWTAFKYSGNELHLFAGVVATGLALVALVRGPRRDVWIYLALTALAAALSLGSKGSLYEWLHAHVWFFRGFRAPARFSILAFCSLAVLAGFGFQAIKRLADARPAGRALLVAVLVAIGVECGSAPMGLADVPAGRPPIYQFLRTVEPTVIAELPMVDWDMTALFMYGSTFHWQRLINGYSGYAPPDYPDTRERMRTFPDAPSIARLRELGARYVLIHEAYYQRGAFAALMGRILRSPDLIPGGRYRDWLWDTYVFELKR